MVPVQPSPARRGISGTAPSGAGPFAFLPFPLPKHTSLIKAAYLEALNPPACKGGRKAEHKEAHKLNNSCLDLLFTFVPNFTLHRLPDSYI